MIVIVILDGRWNLTYFKLFMVDSDGIYRTVHDDFMILPKCVVGFVHITVVRIGPRRRTQFVQALRIIYRAILGLDYSRIPVPNLIESRLGSANLIALIFVIWVVVFGVTSLHFHFIPVLFPIEWVHHSPLLLLALSFNPIGVRLSWHGDDLARCVPYLIPKVRILIIGGRAGPVAYGLVVITVGVVIVDLYRIVQLNILLMTFID